MAKFGEPVSIYLGHSGKKWFPATVKNTYLPWVIHQDNLSGFIQYFIDILGSRNYAQLHRPVGLIQNEKRYYYE